MSNEALFFSFLVLDLGMVLVLYRLFGKAGLYIVISYSIILCNIQVLKQVRLFGFDATLGNILYASIFLSTDILSEFYSKKDAQRGVLIGFIVAIIMMVYMQVALRYTPNEYDTIQPHLNAIFGLTPAVVAASLLAYLCSNFHDVTLYEAIKKRMKGRHLWLRNNAATMLSQLIDTVVFSAVMFALGAWSDLPFSSLLQIIISTYFIKVIVAFCDTPYIYLARLVRPAKEV